VTIDQILGWTATFLFTVCYVPQILKTLRSGTIGGLSLVMLMVQVAADTVALAYATMIAQPALQVKYTLALLFLAGTFTAVWRVWSQKRHGQGYGAASPTR